MFRCRGPSFVWQQKKQKCLAALFLSQDFLSLAAYPQPQPLALQARLRGLLQLMSLAALVVTILGGCDLKIWGKKKNAAW